MDRIKSGKNVDLLRHLGEVSVDAAAAEARSRFATMEKYQIYDDKRNEALRFMEAVEAGQQPNEADFPYLSAETGVSAATMLDLAYMWIYMDSTWKQVAALIEKISIDAKIRIREQNDHHQIDRISQRAAAVLDVLGEKPPSPPKVRPF